MKMERRAAGKESRYDDEDYYKSEEEREREREMERENENENELMEVRRGPWTVEEDFTLINYIAHHGEGRWNSLSRSAGLKRTGKSCRLRWLNYLRPDVRRGNITLEEQLLILELHSRWGNRWSKIAQHLPGRTDNEIKNYWRTRVQKHAKQLKCDVNSKQFKDTMRYLWMPRLIDTTAAADDHTQTHLDIINTQHQHHHHHPLPDNTCPDALPDNSASPPPAYYNNINCNQHHLSPPNHTITYGDHHSLTTDYFNQPQPQPQPQPAFDFSSIHQNSTQLQWIGGGGDAHDASNNLWNIVDDIWFSHNCHL